jgi:hypothetical protein
MPFAAAPQQNPMGFGQFSMQGNMNASQAAMILAAAGQLSPQQMNALMQLIASGQLSGQGLMQLAAQLQLTPAQINALMPFLAGGIGAATPPNTGTAFAAANPAAPAPVAPAPAVAPAAAAVAPAPAVAAPATAPAAAPATGAATTPAAGTVGHAAPAKPLSPAELQEQIRLAEQRLKELDELRTRAQN